MDAVRFSGVTIPQYSEIATANANKEFLNKTMANLASAGPNTTEVSARIAKPQHHVILKHPFRDYQLDEMASVPQMPVFVELKPPNPRDKTEAALYSIPYLNKRMSEIHSVAKNYGLSEADILAAYMFNDGVHSNRMRHRINAICRSFKPPIRPNELFLAFPMLFSSAYSFMGVIAAASINNKGTERTVSVAGSTNTRCYWKTAVNGDKLFFTIIPPVGNDGKRRLMDNPPQICTFSAKYPTPDNLRYESYDSTEYVAPVLCIGIKKTDETLTAISVDERSKIVSCGITMPQDIRNTNVVLKNYWFNGLRVQALIN